MAQQEKDPVLSLQWLGSLLWHMLNPWTGNSHMLREELKKKKKKKKKKRKISLLKFKILPYLAFSLTTLYSNSELSH